MVRSSTIAASLLLILCTESPAGVKSKAARETAEYLLRKFGVEVAEQGVETLGRKIEVLAVRYGDDALTAVRKVGPRAIRVVEASGEHGAEAIKLMARRGDDALWVVAKKNRMAIFLRNGNDAAEAMIKHREIAEPLLESLGRPAAVAFRAVSGQNGRRLAMMSRDGTLTQIGRTPELLAVVGKHGDRAMDFIWRNKSSLAFAAGLAAFLAHPEPFLDGTVQITKIVAENAVKPLAEAPKELAIEIGRQVNWTVLGFWTVLVAGIVTGIRYRPRRHSGSRTACPEGNPNSSAPDAPA